MNLVFDLDDTLLDTLPGMVAALNTATGKDYDASTMTTYDLPSLYGIDPVEVQRIIVAHRVLENVKWLEPHNVLRAAFWRWACEGHQIVFCTARAWHPNAHEVTDSNLTANGDFPCEVVIVNHGDGYVKADALIARGLAPHVFVDDNYRQVVGAHKAGATSWLRRRRHNTLNLWGNTIYAQEGIVTAVDRSIESRRGG
jgi:hypothetical protein